MTDEKFMSYIAREKCGAIVCAVLDNPEHKKDTAKYIARWIREGLTVERVDSEIVRKSFTDCPKDSTKKWDDKTCKLCEFNR